MSKSGDLETRLDRAVKAGDRVDAKRRTYAQARAAILEFLDVIGWEVHRKSERAPWAPLKIPYAITPNGSRVEFKAQSVYMGGHSLWIDLKEVSGIQLAHAVLEVERRPADFQ